jgi:predicted ferric reductase
MFSRIQPRVDHVMGQNTTALDTDSSSYTNTNTDGTFASLFPFSVGLNGVDQDRNYLAINVMAVLFLAALVVTLFLRFSEIFHAYSRQLAVMGNPEHQTFWKNNRGDWWPWLKKHLIYAPLWKKRHNQEIALSSAVSVGTLPGRAHFFLLCIYSIFTLAWTLTLPYGKPRAEVIAALRGRSGVIAVFNLFPTIIFALRNNPFIPILGVSFDTFQLFHRWAARIFILEAIVHSGSWLDNTKTVGGWGAVKEGLTAGAHAPSYSWGLVGTASAFLILFLAWSPVRHAFYESFLAIHKLLVFFVLLGTLLHLKLDNLPQTMWLVLIFVIWASEYAMRIIRIVRYNVTRRQASSRIIVQALSAEACRVTFHLPGYWKPKPGTHVHAYLPQFALFQSHPFSVAWTEVFDLNDTDPRLPVHNQDTEKPIDYVPNYRSTVSIVCRARTGFTRQLWEKVRAVEGGAVETWGFVEGFYGGHDNLSSYGDVVLFAGGVGITHQIMFCKQLVEGYNSGTVACRRVTLVWSVPTKDCLDWVAPWMNEILNMPNRRILVDIKIYVTRQPALSRNRGMDGGAGSSAAHLKEISSRSGKVQMRAERCPVDQILTDVIQSRKGAVAVTVCGPGAFADSVRNAVRWRVDKGVIDFIEEAFTY